MKKETRTAIKWTVIIGIVFSAIYFFFRLFHIMSLPMFTDEAIYVRWAQIARFDAAERFISLTDGKQPLFIWIALVFMHFFSDPLLASRIVSVVAGFLSIVGLFFLGKETFRSTKVGVVSSFLYILYPMALVYNRMALYESLVAMFAIWALYLTILLVRRVRLDLALILGMVIGGSVLTKTSGFLNLPLLLPSLLLFDFKRKDSRDRILKWAGFAFIAVVLSFAFYTILRLSPYYYIIGQKNATFVYPVREWLHHPLTYLVGNLRGLYDWMTNYFSLPWYLLLLISFIKPQKSGKAYLRHILLFVIPIALITGVLAILGFTIKDKDFFPETIPFLSLLSLVALIIESFFHHREHLGEKVLLFLSFLMPFLYLATFGRTLYPRYVFPMAVTLLPIAAYGLVNVMSYFKNKYVMGFVILLFCLMQIRADSLIDTHFAVAPIPMSDLNQYSNDWPAGGGYKEIVNYLAGQASTQKIYVASEGTFGSLPTYTIEIYLGTNPNIEKRGIWPLPQEIPADLLTRAKTMPVYFIGNQTQPNDPQFPSGWPMKLVLSYPKGIGKATMRLYKIESL